MVAKMSYERGCLSFLIASLWSVCTANRALFDVGLVSYINHLDDGRSSRTHFLYPTLSEGDHHIATKLDMEYLFSEHSASGYDLMVGAIPSAPVAPGKYPIVAYLHGTGGFSLDSHTLLTQLAAMGFVVVTADMPGYLVGDTVYASDLQGHMGKLLASILDTCPPGAEAICEAMETKNLAVIGPGVVDPMCTLDGWTNEGVRPSAQVYLAGDIEDDTSCHPVEYDTQDFSIIAIGKSALEAVSWKSEFTGNVE